MSYVIFSIDFENNPVQMNLFHNFLADCRLDSVGEFVPMIGSYKGQKEHSFICRREDFDTYLRDTRWVEKQESILHVASGNKMEATLEYIDGSGRADEPLGCMHQVCREEAYASEAYTYSPSLNAYWIAKQGNPDGSYRRSIQQYRMPVTDEQPIAAE